MTAGEEITRMQERLAHAVASGAFEEAGRLLAPYFARAEHAILELPPAEREEFASRVLKFHRWAISLVRASRAQACAQLRELSPPSPYRSPSDQPRRHWQYEA
jgi:hypothetical protein